MTCPSRPSTRQRVNNDNNGGSRYLFFSLLYLLLTINLCDKPNDAGAQRQ